MRCPYCVSEIADEALACPRCARDLYLFKPLLEKLAQLEKTVAEQAKAAAANSETRIAALEKELAELKAQTAGAVPVDGVGRHPCSDTAQIFDQRQAQHDGNCPQLA